MTTPRPSRTVNNFISKREFTYGLQETRKGTDYPCEAKEIDVEKDPSSAQQLFSSLGRAPSSLPHLTSRTNSDALPFLAWKARLENFWFCRV